MTGPSKKSTPKHLLRRYLEPTGLSNIPDHKGSFIHTYSGVYFEGCNC